MPWEQIRRPGDWDTPIRGLEMSTSISSGNGRIVVYLLFDGNCHKFEISPIRGQPFQDFKAVIAHFRQKRTSFGVIGVPTNVESEIGGENSDLSLLVQGIYLSYARSAERESNTYQLL